MDSPGRVAHAPATRPTKSTLQKVRRHNWGSRSPAVGARRPQPGLMMACILASAWGEKKMGPYRKCRVTACLAALAFVVGAIGALPATGDDQSELMALVAKWVWNHKPTCTGCQPFTVTLNITSISPDGRMTATYRSPAVPDGVSVRPRATITDGKIKVALKVGKIDYNLDYVKRIDSLRGPVDGFRPMLQIRDATFGREK